MAHPVRAALAQASAITAPIAHLLISLTAVCMVLSGALLAIGRLGTRLHRSRQRHDPAAHTQYPSERALPWASICCYIAAGMLLLTALLLVTDTRVIQQ
jgi:hypothetical protein